jgi:predicted TIM-barrel fold metal-dependent hydrolase
VIKEQSRHSGVIRLEHKPLNDALLLRALEIANKQRLPFQFHTGYGDNDIDMRLVNPLHLRPLLHSDKYQHAPLVILHMGYPYVRESAYLSSVYLNVFVDLSLAIPFAVSEAALLLTQLFGLAPTSKLLYASDGFSVPELFWLAARVARHNLSQVLGDLVDSQVLSHDEALAIAAQLLHRNACEVYGISLPGV